ncbi:protein CUP-SHAPED COTYLEDON 2 [Jatropha curcas]|uniref:protein CUP-SHAPED COTYLEDON 2 n=1 Tax=Jatropha curcas TaxID=180498 RepID=UPI0018944EA3|nr:protein CUP-SHAPED COTYLEDON 2 [Jatropha curcas]
MIADPLVGSDSHAQPEHVSCFSTIAAAANQNTTFDFAPPPLLPMTADPFGRFPRNMGVSAFPSLRSLQENLQLPFSFSSPSPVVAAAPFNGGGTTTGMNWMATGSEEGGATNVGAANGGSSGGGRVAMGPTKLDCMWTY